MVRGVSQWLIGFLGPHYSVSGQYSPMKKQASQHAAQSSESSSPDPVLNIVINCMKKPNKKYKKKKILFKTTDSKDFMRLNDRIQALK